MCLFLKKKKIVRKKLLMQFIERVSRILTLFISVLKFVVCILKKLKGNIDFFFLIA